MTPALPAAAPRLSPLAGIPVRWLVVLFLFAGFLVFTAWDQSAWWSQKDDYAFGWFVPIFVGYVVYERWPRIARLLRGEEPMPSARPGLGWMSGPTLAAAWLALGAGSLLLLLGAAYRAAAGNSYNSTFVISIGTGALLIGSAFVFAPPARDGAGSRFRCRLALAGLFTFPALVWLVSAPMLAVVENNLNLFLMKQITAVVFALFDLLGLPIEQRGNILILPTGSVGVEEACSGIRSLTGCLFAGSAVAAVYVSTWRAKVTILGAAAFFAVFTNLLRSIFLTSWAYRYGAQAIEGTVHDVSGYCVLGGTVAALYLIAPRLAGPSAPVARPAPPAPAT